MLAVPLGPGSLERRHFEERRLILQRLTMDDVDVLEVVEHLLLGCLNLLNRLRDVLSHLIARTFDVFANFGQLVQINLRLLVIRCCKLLIPEGLLLVDEVLQRLQGLL